MIRSNNYTLDRGG